MLKIFWRSIADCQSSPAAQISDKDTKRRKDSHPACPQPQRGRGLLAAEINNEERPESWPLQWGRGLLAAEMEASRHSLFQLPRFNGAAAC